MSENTRDCKKLLQRLLQTVPQPTIEETFCKEYLYGLLKKEATNVSLDSLEKLILEKLKSEWQKD